MGWPRFELRQCCLRNDVGNQKRVPSSTEREIYSNSRRSFSRVRFKDSTCEEGIS